MSTLAETHMTLVPSEFSGEANTCVIGRVVIRRGPFELKLQNKSTSQTKGKGKKSKQSGKGNDQPTTKAEVHLLGGTTLDEVLFFEGWYDAARQMMDVLQLGEVYRIYGAAIVAECPQYSTSRLTYYLKCTKPVGVNTLIEHCTSSPWSELPAHHPFTAIGSLTRADDDKRFCLLGVVSHQPGSVMRETPYGPGKVCNAVVKQEAHTTRCAF
jgi:hypothetical protein